MIWFHELVLRHRVTRKIYPAVAVAHGMKPKRVLVNCSCGRGWTRR